MFNTIFQTVLVGYAVLVGAILLNWFAAKLHLISWYEYLQKSKKPNSFSLVWLFVIYPLSLGLIAVTVVNLTSAL